MACVVEEVVVAAAGEAAVAGVFVAEAAVGPCDPSLPVTK